MIEAIGRANGILSSALGVAKVNKAKCETVITTSVNNITVSPETIAVINASTAAPVYNAESDEALEIHVENYLGNTFYVQTGASFSTATLEQTELIVDSSCAQGATGAQGPQGEQGPIGPQGEQGIPGTGIEQINSGPVQSNEAGLIDAISINNYRACLWIVTIIDKQASLYKSLEIMANHNGIASRHVVYGVSGDRIYCGLSTEINNNNLALYLENKHPNPLYISLVRIPTTKQE